MCQILLIIGFVLALGACSEPSERSSGVERDVDLESDTGEQAGADANQPDVGADFPVTFHRDIKPILDAHCTECHVADSIAGFALDDYDEVAPLAQIIAATVEAGLMPPWSPAAECQDFKHARRLDAEEIASFRQWADDGAPAGDPAHAPAPIERRIVEMGEPDYVVDMQVDYKPQPVREGSVDDYRCFVIDPELEGDRFINGFVTHPGNDAVVHHVLLYSVPESTTTRLAELEAADERPGYTCFGGPKINSARLISGWVPGMMPIEFEDRHGIKVAAGSRLVMQIHYNTVYDKEGTDRTLVDLHYVEPGTTPIELAILPLAQGNFLLPAGESENEVTATLDPIPMPLTLHGIVPHMHLLGTSIDVQYVKDDDEICLVDVPKWDFNWQGFYLYEEPLTLPAGYYPRLTCRYDNSPENQADGRQPTNVTWGDGTYDEMCLVYFILRLPPGVNL
ncbi:MAG: hypothetical protein ACNA8W_02600 [Bradymonadaceae bacterium]